MKERIEELARECGLLQDIWIGVLGGDKPCVTIPENLSIEQAKFSYAVFNEALEMAARECNEKIRGMCGDKCAEAIRKLKVKEKT